MTLLGLRGEPHVRADRSHHLPHPSARGAIWRRPSLLRGDLSTGCAHPSPTVSGPCSWTVSGGVCTARSPEQRGFPPTGNPCARRPLQHPRARVTVHRIHNLWITDVHTLGTSVGRGGRHSSPGCPQPPRPALHAVDNSLTSNNTLSDGAPTACVHTLWTTHLHRTAAPVENVAHRKSPAGPQVRTHPAPDPVHDHDLRGHSPRTSPRDPRRTPATGGTRRSAVRRPCRGRMMSA